MFKIALAVAIIAGTVTAATWKTKPQQPAGGAAQTQNALPPGAAALSFPTGPFVPAGNIPHPSCGTLPTVLRLNGTYCGCTFANLTLHYHPGNPSVPTYYGNLPGLMIEGWPAQACVTFTAGQTPQLSIEFWPTGSGPKGGGAGYGMNGSAPCLADCSTLTFRTLNPNNSGTPYLPAGMIVGP